MLELLFDEIQFFKARMRGKGIALYLVKVEIDGKSVTIKLGREQTERQLEVQEEQSELCLTLDD